MTVDRSFRAKIRYRWDEFLSGGAGRQLLFLFVLTMFFVVLFAMLSAFWSAVGIDVAECACLIAPGLYFTRPIDPGTMGGDAGI
jgi:hypothetical protein